MDQEKYANVMRSIAELRQTQAMLSGDIDRLDALTASDVELVYAALARLTDRVTALERLAGFDHGAADGPFWRTTL
ncbi:MAG: hypothetical protein AAF416_18675 [Pseudomonadota bacterium]